jgi:hypothetical protein
LYSSGTLDKWENKEKKEGIRQNRRREKEIGMKINNGHGNSC